MVSSAELDGMLARAMRAHQAGQLAQAQSTYKALLKKAPRHWAAMHYLGLSYLQLGQSDRGIESIRRALALKPDYVDAYYNLATAFQGLGRFEDAIANYLKVIALDPNNPAAHNNLGAILMQMNRHLEAISHLERVLAHSPQSAEALANMAAALNELGRYGEAVAQCQAALKTNPGNHGARLNLGAALQGQGRYEEALSVFEQALQLGADAPIAYLGCGNALAKLTKRREALRAFDLALAARDTLVEAWMGRGNVLAELNCPLDAIEAFSRALRAAPGIAEAWLGRANVLRVLKRFDEAILDYDEALKRNPDLPYALGHRLYAKLMTSRWDEYQVDCFRLIKGVADGAPVSLPFQLLPVSLSPEELLNCAQQYVRREYPASPTPLFSGAPYSHDRIRVGYLSANFQDHAVARLIAGVFEHHDRDRFSPIGFSLGEDDGSVMRQRLVAAFDRFVNVQAESDRDIAGRVLEMQIDILVDLMGFTNEGRPGVLAMRAAPVQVNYLGYPATMGADYIDYIIADRVLIPESMQQFYSEKIVYLPNTYQANDRERRIAEETPSRESVGLPQNGLVFCSFNNSFKINPLVFDVWMRLLQAVDGSVLWLLEDSTEISRNVRLEAKKRGVLPERLVFAPRCRLDKHLARHRLADLFLDTLPYNAHTTASDALWAGLPVLTCAGQTFAGRVAASLLNAIGMPELVTESWNEYEARALELARNPEMLQVLKARLLERRLIEPLFDTARTTRDLERAYTTMLERLRQGKPPDTIRLDA